jgi:hypothetical protein
MLEKQQSWIPKPTAEAQEKDLQVAEEAAVSRLRPIPDGPDQWALCRSSTVTVGVSLTGNPMVGTESVPH